MGFLSGLFGQNRKDSALDNALQQIRRILEDEEFQLESVHPAIREIIESNPAYDQDRNGSVMICTLDWCATKHLFASS